MTEKSIEKLINDHHIEFVDLRFTDLRGKEHHVTLPKDKCNEALFQNGKAIDGSSFAGWQEINHSDLFLLPDPSTAVVDIFCNIPTLNIRCNLIDPSTDTYYFADPRSVARRAEAYLKDSHIADICYIGQEVEFFVFDDVRFGSAINGCFYHVDADEAGWNNGKEIAGGNKGHRPPIKGGYFPVPPVDSAYTLRSEICNALRTMGLVPEVHHHEVATAGQNEITTQYSPLLRKADEIIIFKYVAHNMAHARGKTITFMPKPLVGDNGNGLHCHQSLFKDGKNLFYGQGYAGLSDLALYYIGGIIKHSKTLAAFTNPSTNSYKRLVPGFEAPVNMVYSKGNRSAAIRIPYTFNEKETRIEARFPDAMANPYLAFSALLMAGIDGIKNKIDPGKAIDDNLYTLTKSQAAALPCLPSSLDDALRHLEQNHAFLLEGNVFTHELIEAYLALKWSEAQRINATTHPLEFELYYSL